MWNYKWNGKECISNIIELLVSKPKSVLCLNIKLTLLGVKQGIWHFKISVIWQLCNMERECISSIKEYPKKSIGVQSLRSTIKTSYSHTLHEHNHSDH